jgi:ketol-acid reductoisomerase
MPNKRKVVVTWKMVVSEDFFQDELMDLRKDIQTGKFQREMIEESKGKVFKMKVEIKEIKD